MNKTNCLFNLCLFLVSGFGCSPGLLGGPGGEDDPSTGLLSTFSTGELVALHRAWSAGAGDHFYTTDPGSLPGAEGPVAGYLYEGIEAFVFRQDGAGTVALHRFWNAKSSDHFYTTDPKLNALAALGYVHEGIVGYVACQPGPGLVALRRYWSSTVADHFYTTCKTEGDWAVATGIYQFEGIDGYVVPNTLTPRILSSDGDGGMMPATRVLAFSGRTLVLRGEQFRTNPQSESSYVALESASRALKISSKVISTGWTHDAVTLALPPEIDSSFTVRVVRENVSSTPVPLEVHRVTDEVSTGAGLPLDIAVDGKGRLWVAGELSHKITSVVPGSGKAVEHTDIQPTAHIFSIFDTQEIPTRDSVLCEDVEIDGKGGIWYTQGGDYLSETALTNASRVVRLNPETGSQICYNLPESDTSVTGLLLDEQEGVVWFAASGVVTAGNFIARFRPGDLSCSQTRCDYDYLTPPPIPYCVKTGQKGCFERFFMPTPGSFPAHLLKDQKGCIWVTQFFNSAVARVDPTSGVVIEYPMPTPTPPEGHDLGVGSGPWQIVADATGGFWINEWFDSQLLHFDVQLSETTDCTRLNQDGENPCVKQVTPPARTGEYLHTVALDQQRSLWFTATGNTGQGGRGMLGRLMATGEIQLFPPLTVLGWNGQYGYNGATGIAIDTRNDDLWLTAFTDKKVARLRSTQP